MSMSESDSKGFNSKSNTKISSAMEDLSSDSESEY